jgi:hypothetical protein
MKMGWTRGYKAMTPVIGNPKAGECLGFLYEEGKTYEIEGPIILCCRGFHACKDVALCGAYYDLKSSIIAEVELLGDVIYEKPEKNKAVTNKIRIVRFLDKGSLFKGRENFNFGLYNTGRRNSVSYNSWNSNTGRYNSGHYNSGDCNSGIYNSGSYNSGRYNSGNYNSGDGNSGDFNTGYYNTGNSNLGDCNSGDRNLGDCNTGGWNACDRETGFFNTTQPKTIRVFNKPCPIEEWERAEKPWFIYFTVDPKLGYKGSFQKAFESATKEDIEKLKALPNFDPDVFYEISGIRIDME